MAHELDFKQNGQAAMAYANALPWHGLGQKMSPDADLETWKREAGMDWEALRAKVMFTTGTMNVDLPILSTYKGRDVIYRSDNNKELSIVSSDYKIVQPGQMIDFFASLIQKHGFQIETAGCLFGGRIFWALARIPDGYDLGNGDLILPYALIASSVDGQMATVVHLTSVCVVCNNTLTMAIGKDGKKAIVRVPHKSIFVPELAQIKAGLVEATWEDFKRYTKELSSIKLDRNKALDLLVKSMKNSWKDKEGNEMAPNQVEETSSAVRKIMGYFQGNGIAANLPSRSGTAWGLVNAVTQYTDHDAGWDKGGDVGRSQAFCRVHGITTTSLTSPDLFNLKVKLTNNLLELV